MIVLYFLCPIFSDRHHERLLATQTFEFPFRLGNEPQIVLSIAIGTDHHRATWTRETQNLFPVRQSLLHPFQPHPSSGSPNVFSRLLSLLGFAAMRYPSKFFVNLHFGKAEQPQNLVPGFFPFLAVRRTSSPPHRGHFSREAPDPLSVLKEKPSSEWTLPIKGVS